ncbi:type II toxin-antitoxin system RelE family toxin [Dolichospermum circinale]|uniref:type II toxin-antitoxin system RelE family toxin n=1 Tax=Dolichospermum circinale TaxID=109265 RepID=UPI00232F1124|nr:type II toxin-antitoxin system RelE/ParE family toxin [Dolichospermum circinale]MDB9465348.1 type II toxin-antitoxin system RelE/ParE family toxin [Dolichospermum circinale CS-539/09]MDB9472380.1 type II toxin-antitoxin system RelE/ParE family toxin [Dolichospermum circinale CS-539]
MNEGKQYKLKIKKSARKELLKLQPKFFKQVMSKIITLMDNPQPQDYKSLKRCPDLYRVDQGEFRIIYTIQEEEIQIFRVGKRNDDEVYENL